MDTDDDVDVGDASGDLLVGVVSGMADGDQNVNPGCWVQVLADRLQGGKSVKGESALIKELSL